MRAPLSLGPKKKKEEVRSAVRLEWGVVSREWASALRRVCECDKLATAEGWSQLIVFYYFLFDVVEFERLLLGIVFCGGGMRGIRFCNMLKGNAFTRFAKSGMLGCDVFPSSFLKTHLARTFSRVPPSQR